MNFANFKKHISITLIMRFTLHFCFSGHADDEELFQSGLQQNRVFLIMYTLQLWKKLTFFFLYKQIEARFKTYGRHANPMDEISK